MESADIRVIHLHFIQNADQIQLRKSGISMILNGLIKRFINQKETPGMKHQISQCLSMSCIFGWNMENAAEEEYREFYNYREIADMLILILRDGHTHVERCRSQEYPYDLSWDIR